MPLDILPPAGTLPRAHLVLAVSDCVTAGLSVDRTIDKLPREDAATVTSLHKRMMDDRLDQIGTAGPISQPGRRRQQRRKTRTKGRSKKGLGVRDAADRLGIPQDIFRRLCEHHGVLQLAPYGGRQRRRLVSPEAEAEGLGWNVDGGALRVGRLEGHGRACVFPAFDPDRLEDLAQRLGWTELQAQVAEIDDERERVGFLLRRFPVLTDDAVARLAGGCSRATVQRMRAVG